MNARSRPTHKAMDSGDIDVHGVRDGDASALRSLAKRRGASVLAYCNQVCGPVTGTAAAAETFARARAILRDDENVNSIDPDQVLRRATRHTAAAAARTPQGPPPSGAIQGRGTATCLDVAMALAAAADGKLDQDQRGRLRAHIDDCARCQALAEITRRADASYTDPVNDKIGSDVAEQFVDAMNTVPAVGPGTAPPPVEPEGCVASPVFPVLPELHDEVVVGDGPMVVSEPELPELPEPRRQRKIAFGSFLGRITGPPRVRAEPQDAPVAASTEVAPPQELGPDEVPVPVPAPLDEPESVGPPADSVGPPATPLAA